MTNKTNYVDLEGVRITGVTEHAGATEVRDQDGRMILCKWPIQIEMDRDGAYAVIRVPVLEVSIKPTGGSNG